MRFLIFGGPGIGDTIFELYIAKALKQYNPNCIVDIIFSGSLNSQTSIAELLKHQDYVQNYYCYNKKEFLNLIKLIIKLKANKYNYSLSCSSIFKANNIPAIISHLIRCKIIGKSVPNKTKFLDIPVYINENIHIVEQYQKLIEAIGIKVNIDQNILSPINTQQQYFHKNENIRIVLCLGANITIYHSHKKAIKKQIKLWPISNWIQLSHILEKKGYDIIILGGNKEYTDLCNTHQQNSFAGNNLVGKTSISESLAILSQSNLVIGADTGMMHCAAALGKTTLTLFGGTDPIMWKPYSNKSYVLTADNVKCRPCYGKQYAIDCKKRICMEQISVEQVTKQTEKILNDINQ